MPPKFWNVPIFRDLHRFVIDVLLFSFDCQVFKFVHRMCFLSCIDHDAHGIVLPPASHDNCTVAANLGASFIIHRAIIVSSLLDTTLTVGDWHSIPSDADTKVPALNTCTSERFPDISHASSVFYMHTSCFARNVRSYPELLNSDLMFVRLCLHHFCQTLISAFLGFFLDQLGHFQRQLQLCRILDFTARHALGSRVYLETLLDLQFACLCYQLWHSTHTCCF